MYAEVVYGKRAGSEPRNASGFLGECPRAAKKRFGKVRKYQFCGQLTKPIPVSHAHLSVHYLSFTKRPYSAKHKYNAF